MLLIFCIINRWSWKYKYSVRGPGNGNVQRRACKPWQRALWHWAVGAPTDGRWAHEYDDWWTPAAFSTLHDRTTSHTTDTTAHVAMWLNGLVVSALGIRAQGPQFDSRVVPLFHWVATLGKLFTHIASPVSQLLETGVQNGVFGA